MSVNKTILIGNLGADPELRKTQSGISICTFRIATNDRWTDSEGEQQERTDWHNVVVWRKYGEVCAKYLSKGRQVYVEGKLRTRSWEDQDGNKRYMTEIHASDVEFLGGGKKQNTTEPEPEFDDIPL